MQHFLVYAVNDSSRDDGYASGRLLTAVAGEDAVEPEPERIASVSTPLVVSTSALDDPATDAIRQVIARAGGVRVGVKYVAVAVHQVLVTGGNIRDATAEAVGE